MYTYGVFLYNVVFVVRCTPGAAEFRAPRDRLSSRAVGGLDADEGGV